MFIVFYDGILEGEAENSVGREGVFLDRVLEEGEGFARLGRKGNFLKP